MQNEIQPSCMPVAIRSKELTPFVLGLGILKSEFPSIIIFEA